MKNIRSFVLVCALVSAVFCGNVFASADWDGDNAYGNFSYNNNWYGNASPGSGSAVDLQFQYVNNDSQTSIYYDWGWTDFRNIVFYATLSGGATDFNGNGNGINFYGKIENNDSTDRRINIPLSGKGSTIELDPSNGGLEFTEPIYNDNNVNYEVYGNNGKTLWINSNANLPGSSSVNLTIKQWSFVRISTAQGYGGLTYIDNGELWIDEFGSLNGGNINIGDGLITYAKSFIIDSNGGTTVDENIVVDASNGAEYRTIGVKNSSGTNTYSGTISLSSDVTLETTGAGVMELSGIISGAGRKINVNAQGTVVLSGVNTFGGDAGQVIVDAGNLKVSADNNLGADPTSSDTNYITLDNWGVLWATDTFPLNSYKGIELQSGNGKITVDSTKTLSYAGDIVGGYEFAKDGAGVLELGSSSRITASKVYVDAGTLWVKNTQPFDGSATAINLGAISGAEAAILKLGSTSNTRSMDENITVRAGSSGTKTIANGNTGGNCNFNGKINLYDNLTVDASGGSTVVLGGGVDMSATGNQNLNISGSDDVTISGAIEADTGAAELNFDGTGTLLLSGDNATGIDNQMKINIGGGGVLQVASTNNFGDVPGVLYSDKVNFHTSGGTLYNTADVDLDSNVGMTIADGVIATFQAGDGTTDDMKINGVVADGGSNDGQVKMTGLGALHLLGVNTYGGVTTVESGTVRIVDDIGLGTVPGVETDSKLILNGGALRADVTLALNVNRNIELGASGGSLVTLSGKTLTVNSKI